MNSQVRKPKEKVVSGEQSHQAPPALSQGTVVAGRYTIEKRIGEGAFGEVYLAKNGLGGEVVVKMLKRDFNDRDDVVRRFLKEPRAAASVPSQHIVQVTDAGTETRQVEVDGETHEVPDYHFIVMERLRGEDLSDTLAKKVRLEPREALHIILAVLDGLHDVHALGIVHRDLKPENIYLITQKRSLPGVKIMDFGIAHSEDDVSGQSRLTRTGSSMGTPAYMAPEQWKNPTGVDHRADLYAVGIMLYELLEGDLPFAGATAEAAMLASVSEPPRDMVVADTDLQSIVLKAMQVNPGKRFQNAAEMVSALEEYGRQRSLLPEPNSSEPAVLASVSRPQAETALEFVSDMKTPPRRSRFSRAAMVALAAALTCGIIIIVAALSGRRMPTPSHVTTVAPAAAVPTTPITAVPTNNAEPTAPLPTPAVEPTAPPVVAQPAVEAPPPRRRAERGHRRHRNSGNTPPAGGCHRGPDGENICD